MREHGQEPPRLEESQGWWIKAHEGVTFKQRARVLHPLPDPYAVGATLMITQSFLYNAIFFTSALVLQNFYGKTPSSAALYFFPFAIGNLLGPLLLGRFFDTIGRRKMIGGSYSIAAAVLFVSALLFQADLLSAGTHTALWCLSFFFASAGASAGYLTVSESSARGAGQAISYFFSIAQIFGSIGPLIFGALIGDGVERGPLFWGYVGASIVMLVGGLVAFKFGVDAEGKALEDIAPPLSTYDEQGNQLTKLPV